MSSRTGISVLIRTYNSEKTLPRLLAKLDLASEDEVLVVDSGSEDGTCEVARRFGANIVEAPLPFSYSKSLNAGFRHARNPLVHVLSSHVIPMVPDLLERTRRLALELPGNVVAVYGPAGITGRDDMKQASALTVIIQSDNFSTYGGACGNANALYRLHAWQKQPFDEGIRTDEDKAWARAALQAGSRLAYAPSIPVLNKSHYPLAYMFRKGQSDARAIKRADASPMTLWQLGGALKKMLFIKLRGETDWGNWIRYSAHIFGQFSGSRQPKDNTPRKDPHTRP
jgi:hypothetical protein